MLKQLLAAVVILWGLMALLVRSATPFIADYQDEVAALLSDRLGVAVEVGAIKARWYGLRPLIELHDVRIGDGTEALSLRTAALDIAPTGLFGSSLLDAVRITFDGLQLTAVREPSGQIHLEGLGEYRPDRSGEGPGALPSHVRLINTQLIWIDRKAGKAPLAIDDLAILMDRDGEELKVRARLQTASGSADVAARLRGQLTSTSWRGETYLKVENLDVARLFSPYLPENYGLRSLQLDLESWGRWEQAAPVRSQGSFSLSDLQLQPLAQDSRPLELAHASARYTLVRERGGLQLGLQGFQLQLDQRRWPAGDLALALVDSEQGGRQLSLAADYLHIDDLVKILQVRLPDPALREPLLQLQPHGEFRDLRLALDLEQPLQDWRASARFDGLGLTAWNRIPGVLGLSGSLHGQQDHLVLDLASSGATLDMPKLFRNTLDLTRLRGRIDLLLDQGNWEMRSDELVADVPHLQTRTRLHVRDGPEQPLFVDLQTDFADGDAASALLYYPAGIMGEALVRWLDRAIKSGRVLGGSALFHGPVDDFAFEQTRTGSFEVVFDTDDVLIDYRTGWPALQQLDAHVWFHGNQLDIKVDSGEIYDSQVTGITGRIDSLKPLKPLRVSGRLVGPLQNNLRALQEDALRDRFGKFAAGLRGSGNSTLDLDFSIPLGKHGDYALSGGLWFENARLALPEWQFELEQIEGRLAFNLDGLSARSIKARALGAPVLVNVLPLNDGATRVQAKGRLTTAAIRQQLPTLPLSAASGAADFTIDVDVPPGRAARGTPTFLSIASPLQGIAVDLPAPFGKPANTRKSLIVHMPLSGRPTPGSLSLGKQVAARFSNDGQRVDLVFGGETGKLQTARGLRIRGQLDEVDIAAWRAALDHLPLGDSPAELPVDVDLVISRLHADPATVRDLKLKAAMRQGAWQGTLKSPRLDGRFELPAKLASAPIRVELDTLRLSLPVGGEAYEAVPPADPESGPDPAALPGLRLDIADLRVNEARLGKLRMTAQKAPGGVRLAELSLRDGELTLDASGHWLRRNARTETQISGSVAAADLGDLLVHLGYSRQLEKADSRLGLQLRWPGAPAQFHRATINGKVNLDIGAGRLVELDPGVTRVVGLLNLNALTRRLRLDFSDFYKKGYSFDSIAGDFKFARGEAVTDNLVVNGPTGRIDLNGTADLVERSLDQHVRVTPDLDATLPIASTLAGGPVAGIAVLVAQTVMTKQVDKINRFEYALSGPWDNPEVRQLDSGGTLSKLLRPFSGGDRKAAAQLPAKAATGAPAAAAEAPAAADATTALTATPGQTHASAVEQPGQAAEAPRAVETEEESTLSKIGKPLRGLLNVFRKGESHGTDLPGAGN